MLRREVVVSELAYDVLWEVEVGAVLHAEKHPALHCSSPGATWTEREHLVAQVGVELARLDLVRGSQADPDLVGALRLLARPQLEVYGWYSAAGQPTRSVVGAVAGREGVLAELGNGQFRLRPLAPEWLCPAVASVVPELRPLPGQHHNLPTELLTGDGPAHGTADAGLLQAVGRSGPDAEVDRVRRLLARPRRAAAQFYVAGRGRDGARQRCEFPVNVIETEEGCYLTQQLRGNDGRAWTVATPVDQRLLADRLTHLASTYVAN
ncbi:ESX secretion-associated protein EspG [Longimycelium tulufanense]|uniref:ESX secretion-associated protein EspG n=1 Tax=Longimycelium tulufanense TaxID=907463 RepID=A0A8J3CDQ4_9PSEU|nr:ESX secretion-associated protein EspG [Longimycelium tulufanense]GGM59223.1 ESX secretion-associated protein EspG [Longimycelium tulufanense]